LKKIDWVIVGGESGAGARSMELSWVVDIRNQCQRADVPFFFKQ
jgi:protein gp37